MILNFADRRTERLFRDGECPAGWRPFETVAMRKLDLLDYAHCLADLKSQPGNRLEALKIDRKGLWSIPSTDNVGCVCAGPIWLQATSKSWTTIEEKKYGADSHAPG